MGALSGLAVAALGMGQGGPLIALKLFLPGVFVDAAWPLLPRALLGAGAGATHFVPVALLESLTGLAPGVVLAHALFATGTKAAFGAAGGAAGLAIAERLRHHGVIAPAR